MKKSILTLGIFALCLGACNDASKQVKEAVNQGVENAQNLAQEAGAKALNLIENQWLTGSFEGTLPCASCPGIKTTLTLNKDNTYTLVSTYLESKEPSETTQGKYYTNLTQKSILLVQNGEESTTQQLKVEENQVRFLSADGSDIQGETAPFYILKKK